MRKYKLKYQIKQTKIINILSQLILKLYYNFIECRFDPKRVTMRVGSNNQYAGGYIVKARKIVIHGDYANFLHDLAIIELDSSLEFDNKVNKINLQEENAAVPEGVQLSVPGWGINENGQVPYKLQEVSMEVMSAKECEKAAGYGYKSVLCLKHKVGSGVCRGDDGAPVIHSGRLIGVVSFAFGNCGSEYPDVATSVSYYNHWINAAIF